MGNSFRDQLNSARREFEAAEKKKEDESTRLLSLITTGRWAPVGARLSEIADTLRAEISANVGLVYEQKADVQRGRVDVTVALLNRHATISKKWFGLNDRYLRIYADGNRSYPNWGDGDGYIYTSHVDVVLRHLDEWVTKHIAELLAPPPPLPVTRRPVETRRGRKFYTPSDGL
jgi:hypothetical protein